MGGLGPLAPQLAGRLEGLSRTFFCVLTRMHRVESSRTGEHHCGSHCHDRTAAPPLSIALPLRHCLFNRPHAAQATAATAQGGKRAGRTTATCPLEGPLLAPGRFMATCAPPPLPLSAALLAPIVVIAAPARAAELPFRREAHAVAVSITPPAHSAQFSSSLARFVSDRGAHLACLPTRNTTGFDGAGAGFLPHRVSV